MIYGNNCPVNCPLCADDELEEAHNRVIRDEDDYDDQYDD